MKLPALLLMLGLMAAGTAVAHPLAPALLELRETDTGIHDVLWRLSAIQGSQSVPVPVLPAHCRTLQAPKASMAPGAAVTTHWQIDCGDHGLNGAVIRIENLTASAINVILRIQTSQGLQFQALLDASNPTYKLSLDDQPISAFRRYLVLGINHLVFGPDHLLFLLALIILIGLSRSLIWTLTAFTVGHSITLCLAALNLIRANPALMEFAIAASLVLVARELLRSQPSPLGRAPSVMAFSFGLLHGMGFAGALQQVGLPQTGVVSALIGFNLGIELAQIMIVAAVTLLTVCLCRIGYNWFQLGYAMKTALPAYLIGSLGILWCLERLTALHA